MRIKLYITTLLIVISTIGAMGASRLVIEGLNCTTCTPPIYSTIQGAVSAASTGDTIEIKNRAGYLPWIENVSIPAGISLDIVPYVNDSVFICQGVWTVNPAASMTVNIVGMYNILGGVTGVAPGTNTAANRCVVRILGGQIGTGTAANASGYINFAFNYYDVTVYGVKVIGANASFPCISLFHGSVIGDSIVESATSFSAVTYNNDGAANTDTSFIIGNVIFQNSTSGNYGISWASTSATSYFDIRNNFIYNTDASGRGIAILHTIANNTAINKIINNTIVCTGNTATTYGIYLSPNNTSTVECQNNCIARTNTGGTTFGIDNTNASATVNAYYNFIDANIGTKTTSTTGNNGNNVAVAAIPVAVGGTVNTSYPPTLSATSLGYFSSTWAGVNGGNPGYLFYNIGTGAAGTFTANTVGCYGGPFTIQNYFPMNSGATRTYINTSFPTSANINSTLNFKATSFDR